MKAIDLPEIDLPESAHHEYRLHRFLKILHYEDEILIFKNSYGEDHFSIEIYKENKKMGYVHASGLRVNYTTIGHGKDGNLYVANQSYDQKYDGASFRQPNISRTCGTIKDGEFQQIDQVNLDYIVNKVPLFDRCRKLDSAATDMIFVAVPSWFEDIKDKFKEMFDLNVKPNTLVFTNRKNYINWIVEIPDVIDLRLPVFSPDGLTLAVLGTTMKGRTIYPKVYVLDMPV